MKKREIIPLCLMFGTVLGSCFGLVVGSLLFDNIGLGLLIGDIVGISIGLLIGLIVYNRKKND